MFASTGKVIRNLVSITASATLIGCGGIALGVLNLPINLLSNKKLDYKHEWVLETEIYTITAKTTDDSLAFNPNLNGFVRSCSRKVEINPKNDAAQYTRTIAEDRSCVWEFGIIYPGIEETKSRGRYLKIPPEEELEFYFIEAARRGVKSQNP